MLNITGLTKRFNTGTPDERVALNDFSLTVNDGEFVTLLGGNGSGKSTLFNLIAGSILPDAGSIVLDGKDEAFAPEHQRALRIGRIFQDPMMGTAPNLTIEENLAISYMRGTGRHMLRGNTKKDRQFFASRLESLEMGLEKRMDTRIGLLSGGQRQAITLLMATLVKPQLLLLDEHTAALDPQSAQRVMQLTRRIVKEGNITTMMITHHIPTAIETGSRLLMLASGSIVLDKSGEQKRAVGIAELMGLYA